VRHAAVTGFAVSDQLHPQGFFLRHRHREDGLGSEEVFQSKSSLIPVELGLHFRPVILDHPLCAEFAALFFVRGGQKDHVTLAIGLVLFQQVNRQKLHDAHTLHIDRPAPPYVPVADFPAEGITSPVRPIHFYDVHVVVEQYSFLAAVSG